jgi:hypothetical protein
MADLVRRWGAISVKRLMIELTTNATQLAHQHSGAFEACGS